MFLRLRIIYLILRNFFRAEPIRKIKLIVLTPISQINSRMLRCRAALTLHRLSSDGAKGLKFGGFEDPWWAGSRFNKPNPFEIPGKEKDKFPFINDETGPHRPLK